MTISRLTVDKLGVKLYDRVSAVIAELIANSYDADATRVEVVAPMDELLATRTGSTITDKGFSIQLSDDGCGMVPSEINDFYLVVGAERRNDPRRGDTSAKFHRKVMGRKGVGKLAPFGVCKRIEIISSGGPKVNGVDESGSAAKGYLTSHLILERDKILTDTDTDYHPDVGKLDGIVRKKRGTLLRLTNFDHRRVPSLASFERQLSQRFGVSSADWQIDLTDSLKTTGAPDASCIVGDFSVEKMENTVIEFQSLTNGGVTKYRTIGPDGKELQNIAAGFTLDGDFYPLTGWMGYSKQPYKDELMAGVRIYCRGKIAAQTHIFNLKAGFTGEYDIRSYLVGQLHADWLDEAEDLIRTDRQDILWSHELGRAFEEWGQTVVKQIGALTREPRRKKAWQAFKEKSKLEERVSKAFPMEGQKAIRANTLDIAKAIAQTAREDELQNPDQINAIVDLSMLLGPHITLDQKLREAAEENDDPLSVITGILRTARIAELSAFGQIADDRVKVIRKIEQLKDDKATLEEAFQSLISEAPWLINPQWSPITSNQAFSTLKEEFAKFYKKETGQEIHLDPFSAGAKRADFVLSSQDGILHIIEIKKPNHGFQNDEMDRMNKYVELMKEFLEQPGNKEFKELFPKFHVTLVCDKLSLKGVHKTAFDGLVSERQLTYINWKTFLLRTRKMHEAFLNEAERQRKDAAKKH
ncbi:MAG TPA: ATP-binding protein [Terracidiphilus sp.]|nr:ATP-binding protein [Terracidiphilus sp.]